MTVSNSHVRVFPVLVGILCAAMAQAQEYPNKPIRIVTSAPGGGTDFAARLVAAGLSESLKQPVIVENRSGAATSGDTVARASPDGYTLLLPGSSFWIGPLLQKMPYDPIKDFAPISLTHTQPVVLVVHPSLPVKTVKELIAYAAARPGELNYGSAGVGGAPHLAGALFCDMTGVKMVHVPFKGGGGLAVAMLGGQVQLTIGSAAAMMPLIKNGKLRGLGVGSAKPSPLAPGLPAIAESGVPGYEASQRAGIFAPGKTPTALIIRLNRVIAANVKRPDVREKFFEAGVETVGSSPQEFAAVIKSEMERIGKLIKTAGIRIE